MKLSVEVQPSAGVPYDWLVYRGKQKRYTGFVKVVVEADAAIIYYIYIKPAQRRKGFGSSVLSDMKNSFEEIKTQVSASSKESIDFLSKNGFIRDGDWLVWKKVRSLLTPLKTKQLIL